MAPVTSQVFHHAILNNIHTIDLCASSLPLFNTALCLGQYQLLLPDLLSVTLARFLDHHTFCSKISSWGGNPHLDRRFSLIVPLTVIQPQLIVLEYDHLLHPPIWYKVRFSLITLISKHPQYYTRTWCWPPSWRWMCENINPLKDPRRKWGWMYPISQVGFSTRLMHMCVTII